MSNAPVAYFYVIYDTTTGRIAQSGVAPDHNHVAMQVGTGQASMEVGTVTDNTTNYIDVTTHPDIPALADRPASPTFDKTTIAADGVDAATMSGLPGAATVIITGPHGIDHLSVLDGSIVVTTDTPGAYTVTVDAFPMQPTRVVLNAV